MFGRSHLKRQFSLRKGLIYLIAILILIVFIAMIANNIFSVRTMEKQIRSSNRIMLTTYMQQIEATFKDVEAWRSFRLLTVMGF